MYYYRLISSMLKAVISSLGTGLYAVYKAESNALASLTTSLYAVYKGESNTNDSLGTYNGTAQGGLTYTAGKSGNAFTFNGTNAYVSLPDDSLNLIGSFSYSFWSKSNDTTNYGVVVGNVQSPRSPYSTFHGYEISFDLGKYFFFFRSGTNIQYDHYTTNIVNNGNWNHIVVTYDPTNTTTGAKIYVNGTLNVQAATLNVPIGYTSPMKACIGARNHSGTAVNLLPNGTSIDELNAWNKELTSTEVTDLYNSGNGKFYQGNTFSSTIVNDSLGNYNGTPVGGLTYTAGKSGNAFTFNGVDSAIRLPVNSMNFTNDFSISTWVNIPSGYTGSIIILWNVNGEFFNNPKGFRLGIYSTDVMFSLFNGTNTYNLLTWSDGGQTIIKPNSGWVHIVAVRKKSTSSKIYVNGVLKASNTNVNDAVYSSTYQTPNIGNAYMLNSSGTVTNNDTWAFNGSKIDELNTWNKELTSTEVTELYNAGAGKFYPY